MRSRVRIAVCLVAMLGPCGPGFSQQFPAKEVQIVQVEKAENRRLDAESARAIPGARPGAWMMIEVGDSGTGIPAEALDHVFEPFLARTPPFLAGCFSGGSHKP